MCSFTSAAPSPTTVFTPPIHPHLHNPIREPRQSLYLEAHLPLASKKLTESWELGVCLSESPVNPHYPLQHSTEGLAEYK